MRIRRIAFGFLKGVFNTIPITQRISIEVIKGIDDNLIS